MKKNLILAGSLALVLMTTGTAMASSHHGHGSYDSVEHNKNYSYNCDYNYDGICDNSGAFHDYNGDGICDNCGGTSADNMNYYNEMSGEHSERDKGYHRW